MKPQHLEGEQSNHWFLLNLLFSWESTFIPNCISHPQSTGLSLESVPESNLSCTLTYACTQTLLSVALATTLSSTWRVPAFAHTAEQHLGSAQHFSLPSLTSESSWVTVRRRWADCKIYSNTLHSCPKLPSAKTKMDAFQLLIIWKQFCPQMWCNCSSAYITLKDLFSLIVCMCLC